MSNSRKFFTILIIFSLIIPAYGNIFLTENSFNFSLTNNDKKQNNNGETLPINQLQVEPRLTLSKIFPIVMKNISRTELYTEINFTVENTMDFPLHNFYLRYHRVKDTIEEIPINIHTFPISNDFAMSIEETSSKIIFSFMMESLAEIKVNETIIFSVKFYADLLKSDLIGDGVEWNCSEILDIGVIYEIDDPSQLILEPTQECAQLDFDQDGLTNNDERKTGLDPFIPDFWINWVQHTNYFYLAPENILNPQLIYRTQCYLGVPEEFRGEPIFFTINKLGPYTYLKNLTINSQIYYESLLKINYRYEIPQTLEENLKDITFIIESKNNLFPIEYNVSISIGNHSPIDITGEERDWDGDLLSDIYEINNNLSWTIPDSDADGIMDGLDLAPLWNDTISPGEFINIKRILGIWGSAALHAFNLDPEFRGTSDPRQDRLCRSKSSAPE